jgi:hypothetical protein
MPTAYPEAFATAVKQTPVHRRVVCGFALPDADTAAPANRIHLEMASGLPAEKFF